MLRVPYTATYSFYEAEQWSKTCAHRQGPVSPRTLVSSRRLFRPARRSAVNVDEHDLQPPTAECVSQSARMLHNLADKPQVGSSGPLRMHLLEGVADDILPLEHCQTRIHRRRGPDEVPLFPERDKVQTGAMGDARSIRLPQERSDIWCLTLTDTSTLRPQFHSAIDKGSKLVLRLQNQLYRLSSVRNDLHIAEFFEPIYAEFNANP
jgi:hypothetical protein